MICITNATINGAIGFEKLCALEQETSLSSVFLIIIAIGVLSLIISKIISKERKGK